MRLIYHYTDASALKGILENDALWLSDQRFMNDPSEFHHAIDGFIRHLEKKLHNEIAKDRIKSRIKRGAQTQMENRTFLTSFSSGDLLSQWRGYCPSEGGYAIGFNKEKLSSFLKSKAFSLKNSEGKSFSHFDILNCMYDENEKQANYNYLIDCSIPATAFIPPKGDQLDRRLDKILADYHFRHLTATHKDSSYREESEVRILYSKPGPDIEREYREQLDAAILPTEFREKNNYLLPYVRLTGVLECIEEIIVGPSADQERAHNGLNDFLKLQSHDKPHLLEVTLRLSTIPYRN
ncbi:DUF2971 domain-containing protein [Microbulbifer sp. MCCC 1A16149]|uniref:DUF2971 domain-containing protein n=1 Tax=Microbulbifer sp. MCCC 1A16149 TaxID=3411322 RepID=UPI003D121264